MSGLNANNNGAKNEEIVAARLIEAGFKIYTKGKEIIYPRPFNPKGKGYADIVMIKDGKKIHVEVKSATKGKKGTAHDKWNSFGQLIQEAKDEGYDCDRAYMVIVGDACEADWAQHMVKSSNKAATKHFPEAKVKIMFFEEFIQEIV